MSDQGMTDKSHIHHIADATTSGDVASSLPSSIVDDVSKIGSLHQPEPINKQAYTQNSIDHTYLTAIPDQAEERAKLTNAMNDVIMTH